MPSQLLSYSFSCNVYVGFILRQKGVIIALIYFLVFCEIYCIGFSIKLVKIAQEVDLATWLAGSAAHESHMRSICWKLKSQVLNSISQVTLRLRPSRE